MRLADLPRGENRTILNRLYNGEPPFDQGQAEINNVEINRNFLVGTRVMSDARRQWTQAFLKPGNFFTGSLDSGPMIKRQEWSSIVTTAANRRLKRSSKMLNQIRSVGANTMLHGIGPRMWDTKKQVIPTPLFIASLMIPSETDVDFENMEYFAIFREWTPAQLWDMTHGPKTDPGWNMEMVMNQIKFVAEQVQKQPNAAAYQYMPERIEELIKQDMGYWGSDAVPTIDVWDFYFREAEDGKGWYRRIFLDWGVSDAEAKSESPPTSKNKDGKDKAQFLYTSGNKPFAQSWNQIIHCQFGDCSAVAPFKYHSVRSLGWMLWGVCDLMNRMQCRFTENMFQQLMWFFRVAGQQDMQRIKKADFYHMGVIPQGVAFVPAQERFTPNAPLLDMGFSQLRQLISENAASYTQDFDKGQSGKELTATEVMARVNAVNSMVSGMMTLAYTYEEFCYREIFRRMCIPGNEDKDASAFRLECLNKGVPAEYLDESKYDIQAERVLGQGNKTLEMATVQFLQSIRVNLPPESQRKIDHISIDAATDQPDLAEDLAPIAQMDRPTHSKMDAERTTERIMMGLPLTPTPDMIPEDYVTTWLKDMGAIIQQIQNTDHMGTAEQVKGLNNLDTAIGELLQQMGQSKEAGPKVSQYSQMLGQMMNVVKGFEQRQAQAAKQNAQQNGNGNGAETAAKIQGDMMQAQVKAKNAEESHAQKTAQKQVAFEMEQQRKDLSTKADIKRKNAEAKHTLNKDAASTMLELHTTAVKNAHEMELQRQQADQDLSQQKAEAELAAQQPTTPQE